MQWFNVDKAGLAKLLTRKGKEFIVFELVQNAWDELSHEVRVTLERIPNSKYARLTVEDDNPEGFVDLSHAWTLFAESTKKSDAGKRGRFNLGEKLVLALCEEAEISSTKGTIVFDSTGRHARRVKRERGSVFTGVLRMTTEEIEECTVAVHRLIPPANITTYYNGEKLKPRLSVATVETTLPTEVADEEGYLRKTARKTTVEVYEPYVSNSETGMIYEMGIPVVETGDRYHVNVLQKVPLTLDRDNVTPAYLALLRSIVLDNTRDRLTSGDANSTWVKDAFEEHGDKLAEATIEKVVELRFGEKRVAYDPSDQEANKLAVSKGYNVVYGNQLSKSEWDAIRRTGTILPAGQVTPSPKPFQPNGKPLKMLDREKWTPGMVTVVGYVERIATRLVGKPVNVRLTNDFTWNFAACYGDHEMIMSTVRLGNAWFDPANRVAINRLTIHELGHEYSGDHLSSEYHDALCNLGAKLSERAWTEPALFETTIAATR